MEVILNDGSEPFCERLGDDWRALLCRSGGHSSRIRHCRIFFVVHAWRWQPYWPWPWVSSALCCVCLEMQHFQLEQDLCLSHHPVCPPSLDARRCSKRHQKWVNEWMELTMLHQKLWFRYDLFPLHVSAGCSLTVQRTWPKQTLTTVQGKLPRL